MDVLETIFRAAAEKRIALMLDLDGAVVSRQPGIHDPVTPDFGLEGHLLSLMGDGCPVAINTGRPEKFIDNLFPNIRDNAASLPFWASTETGAHIYDHGKNILFQRAVPGIERLRDTFNKELAQYPGAIVEGHKMCAITISLAAANDKQKAYDHMLTVCKAEAAAAQGINIIHVFKPYDAYIEIVPDGIHKGTASEKILAHPEFHGKVVVCFGDSNADENMMAVVNNPKTGTYTGYSIGVGAQSPAIAHKKVASPQESQNVIAALADLARQKITPEQALQNVAPCFLTL